VIRLGGKWQPTDQDRWALHLVGVYRLELWGLSQAAAAGDEESWQGVLWSVAAEGYGQLPPEVAAYLEKAQP
jgi:hypothetical protein